jgi:hypothetical protein
VERCLACEADAAGTVERCLPCEAVVEQGGNMTEVSASCALCTVKPETVPEPTVIERTSRKDVPHHLALLTTASQARQRSTVPTASDRLPLYSRFTRCK